MYVCVVYQVCVCVCTCSAVKSGSSLMQDTIMECMSICSLSSSSSDRSRGMLSSFCPSEEEREEGEKRDKERDREGESKKGDESQLG